MNYCHDVRLFSTPTPAPRQRLAKPWRQNEDPSCRIALAYAFCRRLRHVNDSPNLVPKMKVRRVALPWRAPFVDANANAFATSTTHKL